MAQARGGRTTRAVDSLSDSNPKVLEENQRIEERADHSVWLLTTKPNGNVIERRVDSEGDVTHSASGGPIWYRALLKQQKARDEAAVAPKSSRKKASTDE